MSNKKESEEIETALSQGDAWVMRFGITTPGAHAMIKKDLEVSIPKVKYIEYFVNPEERKLDVTLYFGFWTLLFGNKMNPQLEQALDMLNDYLNDYDIKIKAKRYKDKK